MIDWARIDELRDEVGGDDFAEIAGLFLAEVSETLARLDPAADPAQLSELYHGLKGSALNLGFTELAVLCAGGEADPASANIALVRHSFTAARKALCARFPALAA